MTESDKIVKVINFIIGIINVKKLTEILIQSFMTAELDVSNDP